ncbi:MAG: HAD family hydrolase [Candidatus Kapabacteria bacterium]|jgi:HAD superfamily hydrolase (TIGR01509 family)|nr:HAD family hydrolase [Candidatus Kapabacteria bacterium]
MAKPTIFFDLDGTLADNLAAMYQIYANFLAEFSLQATKEEFDSLNGPSLREIVSILKKKYALEPSEEELYRMYEDKLADGYKTLIPPMPHAQEILQFCHTHGAVLALVTSAPQPLATSFLQRVQWMKYFSAFVFGNEVKQSKPNPEIYRLALEKVGSPKQHLVAVEDSPSGVKAASAAGLYTIALAQHYTPEVLRAAGAEQTISSLQELPALLTDIVLVVV